MALPRPKPAELVEFPLPLPSLIPIRINAVLNHASTLPSDAPSTRIVDTLLWDWKMGLDVQTAHQLAQQVLTDNEVQGMNRSGRNFVGRVELWSVQARKAVQKQIQEQLDAAKTLIEQHERYEMTQQKRKLEQEKEEANAKKQKLLEKENAMQMDAEADDSNESTKPEDTNDYKERGDSTAPTSEVQSTPSATPNNTKTARPKRSVIPIRLRLIVGNVRIHDDFDWDCSLTSVSPLNMAQSLARDLNLSEDAIVAITTEITEQILTYYQQQTEIPGAPPPNRTLSGDYHGWKEDVQLLWRTLQQQEPSKDAKDVQNAMYLARPSSHTDLSCTNLTAAWEVEPRHQSMHSTYVLSQQKPT